MTLHNFLLFISACIALALIPGPDMVYMLARCIAQGRRAGVLAALGFDLGGLVHATAAALGGAGRSQRLRGRARVAVAVTLINLGAVPPADNQDSPA